MSEQQEQSARPDAGNQRVGKGALPESNRREFRRFRPKKTPKPVDATTGPAPLAGTIDGTLEGAETIVVPGPRAKTGDPARKQRACRFFNTTQGCKLGDDCPYPHRPPKPTVIKRADPEEPVVAGNVPEDGTQQAGPKAATKAPRKRPPARCRHFNTENGCKLGNDCPYRHLPPKEKNQTEPVPPAECPLGTVVAESGTVVQPPSAAGARGAQRPVKPMEASVKAEQKGSEEQRKIVQTEVAYLSRRFKGTEVVTNEDGLTTVRFTYGISEPDWPFDTKAVRLSLVMSPDHPVEAPSILCRMADNPGTLPQILAMHIGGALKGEIQTRHLENEKRGSFSAYGKWLIHRLDKTILDLFVEGLRKTKMHMQAQMAGISLVMHSEEDEEENGRKKGDENEALADEMKTMDVDDEEEEEEDESEDEEGDGSGRRLEGIEEEEEGEGERQEGDGEREKKKGERPTMEMQLNWTNTSGNVATLEAESLRFVLKCARCGEVREEDIRLVEGEGKRSARCTKCAHAQSVHITRLLVHAASSTIAMIRAKGCRPIDAVLLHSALRFVCLSCNRSDSVQNLSFGSVHKSWCRGCHTLIEFVILSARFVGLFSREQDEEAARSVPKPRRAKTTKESATGAPIVEGEPLPELGTCKHYKKSYRWFRFPCCGRLFPCDTCHEETVKGDHEMKVANRMVCGHCSKEQPYSASKPCTGCDAATTRKKTQFWEGGKGCRDQKSMNRNDGHKHTGGRKKTISKKSWSNRLEKKN